MQVCWKKLGYKLQNIWDLGKVNGYLDGQKTEPLKISVGGRHNSLPESCSGKSLLLLRAVISGKLS